MALDEPLAPDTSAEELPPLGEPIGGEAAGDWDSAAPGGGEDLPDEGLDGIELAGDDEAGAAPPDGKAPNDRGGDGEARSGSEDGREGAAGYTGRVTIGSAQAGHQAFAETIYLSYGDELRTRAPERLARKHCEAFELAPLARRLRGMEWPAEALRPLEEQADRSRLLILSGESGLGKGSLALALAEKLLRRRPGPQRALLAGRPPRDLQVDFARLAGEVKESVVVVEDAFVHANPSLGRLVEELDPSRLRSLDDALRGAGCWVLLTATPESLPGDGARLEGLGVRVALAEPSLDELRRALHRLAQLRLGDGGDDDDRAAVDRLLAGAADAICERLRTLPRIAAFVDGYLLAVARSGGWEAAADRVDGLADWLFEELPEEAPAWSFALALTLAGAVPALGDPPLFAFDGLWRRLDAAVRAEVAGEAPPARPLAALGVGESLLRRTRSEIAGSRPAAVRFRGPQTSGRLWRALLDGPGRQVATLLVRWLREMVDAEEPLLRETAARALGRLGVLEPGHSALPLVERWVRDADRRCFDGTLGGLLQGAHAAGDDDYRRALLRRLTAAVDRGNPRTRFARSAALRDLGEVDLDLALGEMRRALGDDARVLVDRLWQAHRDSQRSIERLAARRGPDGTVAERVRQRAFDQAVERRVPRAIDDGFRALCYGLIGLGLIRDPADVFHGMRPWLATSSEDEAEGRPSALAGAAALALLSERGVVDFLESRPLPLPVGADGGDFAFSRLLLAVAGSEGAAHRLAAALADALAACSHLPPPLASVLRANWRAFLVRWGGSVGRCETFDSAFADLLRRMLPLAAGDAGNEVFRLLQSEPCFRGEDGRLGPFATGVLAG